MDPGYVARLQLVIDTCYAELREQVVLAADELEALVCARLGLDPADPLTEEFFADLDAEIVEDPGAPVVSLAAGVLVHAPALAAGAVLTRRLSAAEHVGDHLDIDDDLAAFLRNADPRLPGDEPLEVDQVGRGGPVSWVGPQNWLAGFPLDALLAVRATVDGAVTVTALDAEPAAPAGVLELLRAAYDAESGEAGLAVSAERLVLGMLHRDRSAFAQPLPPLSELAAAAGLLRRDHEFANEAAVWARTDLAARHDRLADRLDPDDQLDAGLEAVELLLAPDHDPRGLRRALELLGDPEVLVVVTDEILGEDDDPDLVAWLVGLSHRLVAAAGRSPRAVVARWIAAVAAERDGRVDDAESHLRAATAEADGWAFTEDRLAWYESDRGDAAAALGRWRMIDIPDDDPDVEQVARFAAAGAGAEQGRNDPCWCGSGRKFKQCHLGRPVLAPLPERADWLYRKSVAYLERRGGAVGADHDEVAWAAAGHGDLDASFTDPLVVDVVLHEYGWAQRFVAERGPLLPADELELATSWLSVARSVHEVLAVAASGLSVRELRTGDRTEIVGIPPVEVEVGTVLLTRVVPDGGRGHRMIGGAVAVARADLGELLEILDDGDGLELVDWVAALS